MLSLLLKVKLRHSLARFYLSLNYFLILFINKEYKLPTFLILKNS